MDIKFNKAVQYSINAWAECDWWESISKYVDEYTLKIIKIE